MVSIMPSKPPSLVQLLRAQPALRRVVAIRVADELGAQMLNVAIGWYVYATTGDAMSLAYVGLAQFAPNLGLALVAGHVADRVDRRAVVGLSLLVQTLSLAGFAAWAVDASASVWPVYALLVALGAARAFFFPAMAALLPQVVGAADFPRAVAAAASAGQLCAIAGPAVGGAAYAVAGAGTFVGVAALYGLATLQAWRLAGGRRAAAPVSSDPADRSLLAGLRAVRANRLLLGLISLDLVAVLLGGVTALLPIFARDILAIGPAGLGALRCAPGVGAALVGLVLAHRAIARDAGRVMLGCVAGFGLAIVLFALSRTLWLSLVALAVAGGFDMVSMVIRHTLLQTATPDALRGRVGAVAGLFVAASSELGEFESGVTAALFGAMPAALLGGLATVAAVVLWRRWFPELRRADRSADA